MKKLLRLVLLSLLFIILFTISYAVLPAIVWVFGGGFTTISQNIAYILFGSLAIVLLLGHQFHEAFDENFYEKN